MSNFRKEIAAILKDGIKEYGTRYHTQCKVVYYYWSQGYTKEKCNEVMRQWYFSHSHQSKDWKKNPDRVLRNLKSAIDSFYRNAELKGYQPGALDRKSLTTADVEHITELTSDYRNQKFLFSLMEYALNRMNEKGRFRLPRIVITTFDCCSDKSYQDKMHFCESLGLIRRVREYYRQEKRARTYVINYSFCEDGVPVNNLEQALKLIFDLEILRLRYSRWVYKKILREG